MKNKRLAVILIIFAVITLFIVLGSAVFTLSKVDVNWLTTTNIFSLNDNNQIIESGKFNKGESIFFINKEKYLQKLEEENPYLKVVNIETVFPNKITIHLAEREAMYAIKVADSATNQNHVYVFIDNEAKVLEIRQNEILPNSINPIIIERTTLTDADFTSGKVTDKIIGFEYLSEFNNSVIATNYSPTNLLASINIQKASDEYTITATTCRNNIQFLIKDSANKLNEKVVKLLTVFDNMLLENKQNKLLRVEEVQGEIIVTMQ